MGNILEPMNCCTTTAGDQPEILSDTTPIKMNSYVSMVKHISTIPEDPLIVVDETTRETGTEAVGTRDTAGTRDTTRTQFKRHLQCS